MDEVNPKKFFLGDLAKMEEIERRIVIWSSFESRTVTLLKLSLCQFQHFPQITLIGELLHLQIIT